MRHFETRPDKVDSDKVLFFSNWKYGKTVLDGASYAAKNYCDDVSDRTNRVDANNDTNCENDLRCTADNAGDHEKND